MVMQAMELNSLVSFEYSNGFFNRRERQFYGFGTVKPTNTTLERWCHLSYSGTALTTAAINNPGRPAFRNPYGCNGLKQTGSEKYLFLKGY